MPQKKSLACSLSELPEAERTAILRRIKPSRLEALRYSWRYFWARPEQLAPGSEGAALPRKDWTFWLQMAGRGFGKSRSGAEWIIERAKEMPDAHLALVAATTDDARKTMLSFGLEDVDGASGILAISPRDFYPIYEPSKRILTWPNGCIGTVYSAEKPDRLRGPQHHGAWVDEIAAWTKLQSAWDMLLFGLRLGNSPQACITTTPRPVKLLKDLLNNPQTVVTTGTTYDNRANLAQAFFNEIVKRYEGTRLGRQELLAELLTDAPGALWRLGQIDAARVKEAPTLQRIVVAIDPAVSTNPNSSETGIIVAGKGICRCLGQPDTHGFILADASGKYTPHEWAREAIARYRHHKADRVIGEVNNGGDLVEANLRTADKRVAYRAVHASRGKMIRAEPVAALYEQGKVHHVGAFPAFEDQLTTWDPAAKMPSPDRLDAGVWGITDLMIDRRGASLGGDIALPDLTGVNPFGTV